MAESTLSLSYLDLKAEVGFFLGYTRATDDPGQVADIESCIQSGVRQFFFPPPPFSGYRWNFFRPVTTLTTSAPYSTGTVTVTNSSTTVTGSGTVFPSWAASGVFVHQSVAYEIATRTSDTVLVLATAFQGDTASSQTYEVNQQEYDLPDDFGNLNGDITFTPETTWPGIRVVSDSAIRAMRQAAIQTARPLYAAVRPKAAALTTGQRMELMLYPTPDDDYVLTYPYQPFPGKLTLTNLYTYGGMAHAETLLEACVSVAEQRINDGGTGLHTQLFMQRLAASVEFDKRLAPAQMGYNGDRSMHRHSSRDFYKPLNGYASYNGSFYLGD